MSTDQLTVVLTTHQRARYLERLLRYLAGAGLKSKVLVADSSTEGIEISKRAVAEANAHFPCEYVDVGKVTWYRKCHLAFEMVKTPLVMLLADDDFVVPATLEAAAARMLADPSISIAHGRAMSLSLDHGPGIDPMQTVRSRSRKHLVAEHESPVDRISHYLRNYASIFYSVARTPNQLRIFKAMADLNQDYDFGQTMAGCMALAQGKSVAVDGLYYVVMDTAIGLSRTSSNLMVGWRGLVTKPDFSQKYAQFKGHVLDEVVRCSPGIARADAEYALDVAFVDYFVERVVNNRMGELERLSRNAKQAVGSLQHLGAVASRGLRTVLKAPASAKELASPRKAFARWARALDPLSLEALKEGAESGNIDRVLSAIEAYPG